MDGNEEKVEVHPFSDRFEGEDVKVYLLNGKVMVGVASFKGKFVHVCDPKTGRETIANMDHVISMARR